MEDGSKNWFVIDVNALRLPPGDDLPIVLAIGRERGDAYH
jgi:hypothetical protein